VLTALRKTTGLPTQDYDLHINFPGGIAVDGPSAGVAVATAVYSTIKNIPVDNQVAMTGEISIQGRAMPVGGVMAKVEAALQAGIKRVLVPKDNYQEIFRQLTGIEIIPDFKAKSFKIKKYTPFNYGVYFFGLKQILLVVIVVAKELKMC